MTAAGSTYKPQSIAEEGVESFIAKHRPRVVDQLENQLEELFKVEHPHLTPGNQDYLQKLKSFRLKYAEEASKKAPQWWYYPWRHCMIRVLEKDDYYRVRTARNRNLINEQEQAIMAATKVAVAGLSVGSSIVVALARAGFTKLTLADADTIELTNLNRLAAGITDIGLPKTVWAARILFELDPYLELTVIDEGIHHKNYQQFVANADIVVDEIDDLLMKVRLRQAAKSGAKPILMATDNGDNVLLDIERFDQDPNLDIFHGLLNQTDLKRIEQGNLAKPDWTALALKIIGLNHAPLRMLECVPEIGHTLAGAPQLGSTAMTAGALVAYAARMIAGAVPIKGGKLVFDIEQIMWQEDYFNEAARRKAKLLGGPGEVPA